MSQYLVAAPGSTPNHLILVTRKVFTDKSKAVKLANKSEGFIIESTTPILDEIKATDPNPPVATETEPQIELEIVKVSKEYSKKGSRGVIHFFPEKESILENLNNRRNRPVALYKMLISKALAKVNLVVDSARWSQKAGCRCGCSPGFVIRGGYNVYVTYRIKGS